MKFVDIISRLDKGKATITDAARELKIDRRTFSDIVSIENRSIKEDHPLVSGLNDNAKHQLRAYVNRTRDEIDASGYKDFKSWAAARSHLPPSSEGGEPDQSHPTIEQQRQRLLELLPHFESGELSAQELERKTGIGKLRQHFSIATGKFHEQTSLISGMNESQRKLLKDAFDRLRQDFVNSGQKFAKWTAMRRKAANQDPDLSRVANMQRLAEQRENLVHLIPDIVSGKLSVNQAGKAAGIPKLRNYFSVKNGTISRSTALIKGMGETQRRCLEEAVGELHQEYVSSKMDFRAWTIQHLEKSREVLRQPQPSSPSSSGTEVQPFIVPEGFDFEDIYSDSSPYGGGESSAAASGGQSGCPAAETLPGTADVTAENVSRTEFDLIIDAMQNQSHFADMAELQSYIPEVPKEKIERLVRHRDPGFELTPFGKECEQRFCENRGSPAGT